MNPGRVAGVATLLVAATKLIMLSQEGSPFLLYFLNAMFVYVFWGSIFPVSYAISGKNYIIRSSMGGPDYKVYRKESPFRYYLIIIISTLFATFALGIFFRLDLVERVLELFF
jgi:hypothetical protein